MKKIRFSTILRLMAVILAISVLGCSKEEKVSVKEEVSDDKPQSQNKDTYMIKKWTGPSTPRSINAGISNGPQTLTTLQLGTNSAKVLWNSGDSFDAFFLSGGSLYWSTFTTTEDGVGKAVFTGSDPGDEKAPFMCLYPSGAITKFGKSGSDIILGTEFPQTQTAVPNGLASGLHKSAAYTTSLSNDLVFYNIPTIIKFKLKGSIVPSISSITLSNSDCDLTGDIALHVVGGIMEPSSVVFTSDKRYKNAILEGTFAQDNEYMFVVCPGGTMNGFTLKFEDGSGYYTTKISTVHVALTRSRIIDFGTINLGDAWEGHEGDMSPILYKAATKGTKPVSIAVIPEGFVASEMSDYVALAQSGIDALFATEPFKSYSEYFNVWILRVASAQSGASITDGSGTITTPVACYFGSRWGETSYSDMKADDDLIFDFVTDKCPDIVSGTHTITEVPILMIINDTRYGGICWSYSNGKGYCMAPYSYGGSSLSWSYPSTVSVSMVDDSEGYRSVTSSERAALGTPNVGTWKNTLVHEFGGHCFSRLGDEYWYSNNKASSSTISSQTWPVPFSMNLSGSYTTTPWDAFKAYIDGLASPDPHYSRIGKYQGGDVCMYGRWRNEEISCMIDNRFYFSAWQRYLIVKRILTLSGDVATLTFDSWLANDKSDDPNRDSGGSPTQGLGVLKVYPVGLLPPPQLVEVEGN